MSVAFAQPRKIAPLWIWVYFALSIGASALLPLGSSNKALLLIGALVALSLYLAILQRLRLWTYSLTRSRAYDQALFWDKLWRLLPGYGPSLKGPILFNAGRYAEVQALLVPKALDSHGQPSANTLEFYTYCLALMNDGHQAEAQRLLELALLSPGQPDSYKVALATCLLDQEKDPDRARVLLEQAMAAPKSPGMPAYEQHADDVRRTARYAWALASCGMRDNAEAKIQEALAKSSDFKPDDLAGVEYFVGEAWRSLGEDRNARDILERALALHPAGVTVLEIRKAMAKLKS